MLSTETIAAIATANGRGGVGVVRVSGPLVRKVALGLLGALPIARQATVTYFKSNEGDVIDQGLVLYFPGPKSFTGEDVLELQGHGGPVVLDRILNAVLDHGARPARPGEFSERAFLNDKIDLVQAEAIADLIDAGSEQAARSAMRSLCGHFSRQINKLLASLVELRAYVEAAIDFPDEEIDFIAKGDVINKISTIQSACQTLLDNSNQGLKLKEGLNVVIAGQPNAGKSSLLNAFLGEEHAIVTDIEGTTRDAIRASYNLDGVPVYFTDTAGLRETEDKVERLGISRSKKEIEKADIILLVTEHPEHISFLLESLDDLLPRHCPVIHVDNKIDLRSDSVGVDEQSSPPIARVSACNNQGIETLKQLIKSVAGIHSGIEDCFIARRRHLHALTQTLQHINQSLSQITEAGAMELMAEELRLAQNKLSEITGEFSSDDLLGEIFSSFCIGK